MNERYGVVVCPDCLTAKAVDLGDRTSKCHKCGKKLKLEKMKMYYRTDSQEEARWAIGRLNAEIREGELPEEEEEESDDPHVKASKKADIADDERERLMVICRALDEDMDQFTTEDIEEVYSLLDRETPKDVEKKLKSLKEIYEPREGVFRVV